MPTTYTHYVFGQEVKNLLPIKLQGLIEPLEDYYNIGVHGPDILFYYRAFCKNRINQYGVKVHKEPMKTFLDHAFTVFEDQPQKKAAFAYLAGFMTHFILDSTCHPYIRRRIRETGVCHAEIERDWDSVMMQRDHLNPVSHLVARHIYPRPEYCRVIAPYYDLTPLQMKNSLMDMKLVLNHLFRSSFGVTSHLAALTNSLFLRNYNYQHYFVKKNINPKNIDTIHHLDKLYAGCQKECAHMITSLYEALARQDRSFSDEVRFQRHFS
ncbi:MAG: hypothetical protein IJI25_01595 [Eubacterium sp.]|nr:hypothetical protein [Eubacterium sp.]